MTNRGTIKKKRNLSSPDDSSVNPGKRPQTGATGSSSSSTIYAAVGIAYLRSKTLVPAIIIANTGPYSAYHTPLGAFYSPVPTPTRSSLVVFSMRQVSLPNSHSHMILNRLNSFDKRIVKLESIKKQLTNMNSKISGIDLRVSSLNLSSSKDISSRLAELDATRAFDISISDEICRKQADINQTLKFERDRLS